jgi:glutathione S-transferase
MGQIGIMDFSMDYEIYLISGSPYAWSVMLAMEVKGLAYTPRVLNRTRDEHKAPEFLAINPRGLVPVLKCGDLVICEAAAILAYLDKKHPEPSLFGTTAEDTGQIWQLISEIDGYIRGPVADGISGPIFRGKAKSAEGADAIKAVRAPAHDAMKWVEHKLGGNSYLTGDGISAADIVLLPVLQALIRSAGKEEAASLDLGILLIRQTYPHIAAWLARIEALPGYDNSYPPHWRE